MKKRGALPTTPTFLTFASRYLYGKKGEMPTMTFWVKESCPMNSATQDKDSIQLNDQSLLYYPDGAGEIIDISMKGLSFLKLTGRSWPQGAFKVDLLLDNATLHIKEIPCALTPPAHEAPDSTPTVDTCCSSATSTANNSSNCKNISPGKRNNTRHLPTCPDPRLAPLLAGKDR